MLNILLFNKQHKQEIILCKIFSNFFFLASAIFINHSFLASEVSSPALSLQQSHRPQDSSTGGVFLVFQIGSSRQEIWLPQDLAHAPL